MPSEIIKRFRLPAFFLGAVLLLGTAGYYLLTNGEHSLLDCFYMTVITILTIGFEEVIDSTHNPAIRIFTIIIAFTGIGTATFFLSNITAIIVEGQLKDTYKKKKIKKIINKMENHYIVCGAGRVGTIIIAELLASDKKFVVIDDNPDAIEHLREKYPDAPVITGDAGLEETLLEANIRSAVGVFASTGDDNNNLVISLTAKDINPKARVVARCLEAANQNKMKKAGADSVITENFIAGKRLAEDMLRPGVVSFIERMFADKDKNLRIEEIHVHEKHTGKRIVELELENFPNTLLLAVVSGDKWIYKPKDEQVITPESKIVVITNPEEKIMLNTHLIGE